MDAVRIRKRPQDVSVQTREGGDDTATILNPENATDEALNWVERLALEIEYRSLDDLRPSPRNARTHSKKQIAKIAASIRQFGFISPIIVDQTGEVIVGHGRLAAAKQLGMFKVPVVQVDHLSDEQKRAYRLADNRLTGKRWHLQPGRDHQFKNVRYQSFDKIRPMGGRSNYCHALSWRECMRMVPATSSASFSAAVCVQYRCAIGLTM